MTLAVPDAIQAVLDRFDNAQAPFDEHELSFAVGNVIKDPTNVSESERAGAIAEVSAFGYVSPLTTDTSVWGTHFAPMATAVRSDGTGLYNPDIRQADASFIQHCAARSASVRHPILRARYSDLVWDFTNLVTNSRPDVAYARSAIDAYIEAIESGCYVSPGQAAGFASRGLTLAISIRDKPRIQRAKNAILKLHHAISRPIRGGLWSLPFDYLLDAKAIELTEEEQTSIVTDLENVLRDTTNRNEGDSFDPWAAQAAAERLERYYRKVQRLDDMHRVVRTYGNAFESAAGQAEPLLANAWLQPVYEKYRAIGLTDDARRVLLALEQHGSNVRDSMNQVKIPIQIDIEQLRQTAEALTEGTFDQALKRISYSFLPREEHIRELNEKLKTAAPLLSMIPLRKFSSGHVAAVIGAQDSDPTGRLIYQMAQTVAFNVPWLAATFGRLRERYVFTPQQICQALSRSPLFDEQRLVVLTEGIAAWIRDDHVKAIHVLIPQVEHAVRSLVAQLGIPTTIRGRTVGTMQARAFGEMLFDDSVKERIDPNVRLYLLTLFADPRGLNLRNRVAHGLLEYHEMNQVISDRIVHALLVLSDLLPIPENE